MADGFEITGSKSGRKEDGKRKQVSLDQFITGAVPPKKASIPQQSKESDKSSTKNRILKTTTAENWTKTQLAKFMADKWLILHHSKKDEVLAMSCKSCSKYIEKITSRKNLQSEWATTSGCTRLMLDSERSGVRSAQAFMESVSKRR